MHLKETEDWLGNETEALEGFSWRGGSERDTTGILLWSKPYICTVPDGEEVCNTGQGWRKSVIGLLNKYLVTKPVF